MSLLTDLITKVMR